MINPEGKKKMIWDTSMGFLYISCYIIDPFVFSFNLKPITNLLLLSIIRIQGVLIIIDMMLKPFTGTRKEYVLLNVVAGDK